MSLAADYEAIDQLIGQGRTFVAWRIPGEERVHLRTQGEGSPLLLDNIKDLNGRSGFVIAPFQVTADHPIVLIEPDKDAFPPEKRSFDPPVEYLTEADEKAFYADRFARFTRPLLRGSQDKLVLSRRHILPRPAAFKPTDAFRMAVERYIRSYVYLFHTPTTGTWMGSTPEILLSGSRNEWHTVALAGTQTLRDGKLPQRWDTKNWQEQQLVASYLKRQLATLGIPSKERGPYSVRAGEVAHLKSDFFFSLSGTDHLGDLLQLLHPTPAVCGLPKEEAYRFILENEGYDRSYYTGFIGWLDPKGQTDLYVNLRCMRIGSSAFALYAGGGLLAASSLPDEWQETEDKLETMRRLICQT